MKLLIIPNFNSRYDVDMVGGLSSAFNDLGVESYYLRDNVFDHNLNDIAKFGSFDCILRVNRFRPKTLNKNVRHISWFQDFDTIDRSAIQELKDGDILYTTGDLKRLGISLINSKTQILPLAVDLNSDKFNKHIKQLTSQYDFGLVGFIPDIPVKKSNYAIIGRYICEFNKIYSIIG